MCGNRTNPRGKKMKKSPPYGYKLNGLNADAGLNIVAGAVVSVGVPQGGIQAYR
jgi:hypothetical protein